MVVLICLWGIRPPSGDSCGEWDLLSPHAVTSVLLFVCVSVYELSCVSVRVCPVCVVLWSLSSGLSGLRSSYYSLFAWASLLLALSVT